MESYEYKRVLLEKWPHFCPEAGKPCWIYTYQDGGQACSECDAEWEVE